MRVSELMSRDVDKIGQAASCHDAIQCMAQKGLRHLPVVTSDGTLVGMITDRDIRHHLLRPEVYTRLGTTDVQSLLSGVTVSEIMSWPPVTTTAEKDVTEAAAHMRRSKIGSLLVVDGPRLVGILTESDLLREIMRASGCCCPEVESIVVSYP